MQYRGMGHVMKFVLIISFIISVSGCAVLKKPSISKTGSVNDYQYALIPQSNSMNASSAAVYGNQYGIYGASTGKEVNPSATIEGILMKRGIIGIHEIRPDFEDKTLVVRYGESGKRIVAGGLGGYTLEVTIMLLNARTYMPVYSCTAEGQGSTEVDDIREAIHRCLSEI